MAKLHFLKEGEITRKKDYIPASVKVNKFRQLWKIAAIVLGVINVAQLIFIYSHISLF